MLKQTPQMKKELKKLVKHYEENEKGHGKKHELRETRQMEREEHANAKKLIKKAKKCVVKMAGRI